MTNRPEVITDPDLAERIIAAYKERGGVRALAQRFGVGRRAIERLLEDRNVPRRSKGAQPAKLTALEQAVATYRAGSVTIKAAAESAGISGETLSRHLEARGIREIPKGRGKATEETDRAVIDEAITAYRDGATIAEAARQAGISDRTLIRWMDRLGTPRRHRS